MKATSSAIPHSNAETISIRVLTLRRYPAYPLPRMALSPRLSPRLALVATALAALTLLTACSGTPEPQTAPTTLAPPTTEDAEADTAPEPTVDAEAGSAPEPTVDAEADTAPEATEATAPAEPEPTTTVQQVARPYELPFELEFTATLFDGSSFEGVDVARQDVLFRRVGHHGVPQHRRRRRRLHRLRCVREPGHGGHQRRRLGGRPCRGHRRRRRPRVAGPGPLPRRLTVGAVGARRPVRRTGPYPDRTRSTPDPPRAPGVTLR